MFDTREQRIEIFQDTMKLCRENPVLDRAVQSSIANTKLYPADCEISLSAQGLKGERNGLVSVTRERSFQAAKQLHEKYPDGRIAVHNFASATNPGGGVERGSSAQEEALCRCSTLYPCLKTRELMGQFYYFHRNRNDVRYTDACIYTPGVLVVKSDTDFPERLPEEQWFSVDVLTCAAPNLRERPYNAMNPGRGEAVNVSEEELFEIHRKRGAKILRAAVANGACAVVLGAFGCGAFCNSPAVVARAYRELMGEYAGYFDEIRFAVYCPPNNSKNYEAFRRFLG